MDIGNAELAKDAEQKNAANVAHVLYEMELLRDIVMKAVRLRELGRAYDSVDEALERMWATNCEFGYASTRSGTPYVMVKQAFDTAMKDFDESVLRAVEAGMEWAKLPERGPRPAPKTRQSPKDKHTPSLE